MKFDEFIKQAQTQQKPEGVIIDGTFGCQRCSESVDEAEYFPVEKFLRWKCSQGHLSYIEDFR